MDQTDNEGTTVLQRVCYFGPSDWRSGLIWKARALQTLLLGGADPLRVNMAGQTAFQSIVDVWEKSNLQHIVSQNAADRVIPACAQMADIFLDSLQRAGDPFESFLPRHLLYLSLWHYYQELADKVLEHIPEIGTELFKVSCKIPLQAACSRGCSLNLLRKLLHKSKTEIRNRALGSDLIRFACVNGKPTALDIVAEVLDWDADPDDCASVVHFQEGQSALMRATQKDGRCFITPLFLDGLTKYRSCYLKMQTWAYANRSMMQCRFILPLVGVI